MDLQKLGELKTMSSREISAITGKNHQHVLRDCDKLNESYDKLGLSKIGQCYFTTPTTGDRKYRELILSKMQTMDLMTGYSIELRIKVNRRWEELEAQQFKIPQTFSEALQLAAEQTLVLEQQAKTIADQAPKVLFTDAVVGSQSSCLIGELAKLITQNGYEIGQNRLFEWLRENNYLGKHGERKNIPNQQYVEQGLFELKKGVRTGNGGEMHTTITTKVTGKGQVYFVNKFLR